MDAWATWDASSIWSVALIGATITLHASGVVLIAMAIDRVNDASRQRHPFLQSRPGAVAVIVCAALSLVILHAIECIMWAIAYVHLGALPSPADAELYSVDSMTTRGSTGLMLERQWRMMGAAESGDGMLLFGVSTAFLFSLMRHIWRNEKL